jgi:hypothetical protein
MSKRTNGRAEGNVKLPAPRSPVAEPRTGEGRLASDSLDQECLDLHIHLPPGQQREVLMLTLIALVDQLKGSDGG